MPRGKPIGPETIYQIMASFAMTGSYAETSRQFNGIGESTVRKLVKDNRDKPEFASLMQKQKADFAEKAEELIDLALLRLRDELEDRENRIPVNQLTTAIGTLYDKRALALGESTDNTVVEIKLPEAADGYAG